MTCVLANAIVDVLKEAVVNGGLTTFRVEVWGKPPYDFVKTYTIQEKSDNLAAQEGLRRFVSEMEESALES